MLIRPYNRNVSGQIGETNPTGYNLRPCAPPRNRLHVYISNFAYKRLNVEPVELLSQTNCWKSCGIWSLPFTAAPSALLKEKRVCKSVNEVLKYTHFVR